MGEVTIVINIYLIVLLLQETKKSRLECVQTLEVAICAVPKQMSAKRGRNKNALMNLAVFAKLRVNPEG